MKRMVGSCLLHPSPHLIWIDPMTGGPIGGGHWLHRAVLAENGAGESVGMVGNQKDALSRQLNW